MKTKEQFRRHIYWIEESQFGQIKTQLKKQGIKLSAALKTPCETLNAQGNKAFYASPGVWNRVCVRQGSWFRESDKSDKTLVVSETRLPEQYDVYLDAVIDGSDFKPTRLPSNNTLVKVVESSEYKNARPDEWEQPGIKDKLMFKILFTITGYWGWGENLNTNWLTHRANHANFLAKTVSTEIDGETVPYSVSENSGVCSSCVEFFNINAPDTRKLVAACPGSITFSTVERDLYYDVKPIGIPIKVELLSKAA